MSMTPSSPLPGHRIQITVNRQAHDLRVPPQRTLLELLREDLGLTGTKKGCDVGDCGACTVILNGAAVNACLVLAVMADGGVVETIEGLAQPCAQNPQADQLHPLQASFLRHGASQCGFCSPGMIMAAKALLAESPRASEADVKQAIAGNLCRCTGYKKIVEAISAVGRDADE